MTSQLDRNYLAAILDEAAAQAERDGFVNGLYQRRVISSNERPVFHRIPSRIMEVISRRWY